jgi:hypothetical protein
MAGIRILERSGDIVSHSAVWAGPEEVPVVFVIVKDGAMALAHPDYVGSTLYDIEQGDLSIEEAWDFIQVKTPKMPFPQHCHVRRLTGTGGGAEIVVKGQVVHRIAGVNE